MMNPNSVSVLGAGSYGTALAFCLARNGNPTLLWGRDEKHMEALASSRENARYLPGATFPDALNVDANLETVIATKGHKLHGQPKGLNLKPADCFEKLQKKFWVLPIR